MLNTIQYGDCLDLMHDIPAKSVDLILADLPYASGSTGLAWDKQVIDPTRLWQHYERIIKSNGAILLTADLRFGAKMVMQKEDWFKYELLWKKGNGNSPGLAKIRPLPVHEFILIFSPKRRKITYNPQMRTGFKTWWKTNTRAAAEGGEMRRKVKYGYRDQEYKEGVEGQRYPISVLETSKPNYALHPTQKPVELFDYLIRTYSNPGELVLDNCIGSGTTAVAAIRTGRDFIGIEKDAGYYQIALQQIEKARQELSIFEKAGD